MFKERAIKSLTRRVATKYQTPVQLSLNVSDAGRFSTYIRIHRFIMIVIFSAVLVFDLFCGPFDALNFPIASAITILILGVPHGAFDVAIASHRWGLDGSRDLVVLLAAYVAMAVTVVGAWIFAPGVAMTAFLCVAAYHFGAEGPNEASYARFVLGAAILTATAIFHQEQDGEIFGWLAGVSQGHTIASAMNFAGPMILLTAASISISKLRWDLLAGIEHGMTLAAALILPPITFFLIYFCLLHSVRHVITVRTQLATWPMQKFVLSALPYALAAIAASIFGALTLVHLQAGPALLAAVFVTLAALTVPHMMLIDTN